MIEDFLYDTSGKNPEYDDLFGTGTKQVLILGNANEFMANAAITELKNRGFKVSIAEATVEGVTTADSQIRIYFVIMERAELIKSLLVYLKDIVVDQRKYVCILGQKTEIPEIYKFIPREDVAAVFERPIGVKELGDSIEEVYKASKTDTGKKSILLIDDDPSFLRRTQQVLKNNYKVYIANSGANAIMLLCKHRVDLILLDYDMPVVNGPQVFLMLKGEPELSSIPVMFLTARHDKESVKNALQLEPKSYIIKTTPVDELKKMISSFFTEEAVYRR